MHLPIEPMEACLVIVRALPIYLGTLILPYMYYVYDYAFTYRANGSMYGNSKS